MDNAIPELDQIKRQLMTLNRPKKPKMLVVDDEPDNLDLLYRTFRRDFNVLKAESGIRALEVLESEGEVAVIISDQRMPEMKGTEFLSKTVFQFPNTVRIILTGFTDIEDLVDAINSGQVYKYITKPWDPNELKMVVQKAADTYEVLKQRTEELRQAQNQIQLLATIMQTALDYPNLAATLEPIATAISDNFLADTCILQLVEGNVLTPVQGCHTSGGELQNWLADDPLVQQAIVSRNIQAALNIATDASLSSLPHYQKSGIKSHLSIPVVHGGRSLALISLQWKQPCTLRPDEITTIHLSAQQVALVMTSFQGQ
ncbi:MAG: response regulator [Tychonema bourrellyi B0820]|uniref:Two-component system response regulator n=1 Tax=Tychonema bourrellyi FEM_GT703 TaxID=2040638 RepID=A0A2G4F6I4_9CYAN|nr:response regulator [Tychonema bourrellyi]MDQ2096902.1 response regulator [Tychonema bourrellyi B0820]PHX57382.1 two-component system response regulator [Tychonema bourrellyi FEM_GT703]